jgi:peptidoglycan/LPS O-acetylase OafA/YrhL
MGGPQRLGDGRRAVHCRSPNGICTRKLCSALEVLAAEPSEFFYYLSLMFFGLALSSMLASSAWRRLLANPVRSFFAAISYNLYLYHVILAASMMFRLKWPHFRTVDPHNDSVWQMLFTCFAFLFVVGFSAVVTFAIERPILRSGFSWIVKPFSKDESIQQ